MFSSKARYWTVVGMTAAVLTSFVACSDTNDDSNPVVKSTGSSSLDPKAAREMEVNTTQQDGTAHCVSFAATGKRPQEVKLDNCGPTAVNLVYDDTVRQLDAGDKVTIKLGYDYTDFSVDIEDLDGRYLGGFQP